MYVCMYVCMFVCYVCMFVSVKIFQTFFNAHSNKINESFVSWDRTMVKHLSDCPKVKVSSQAISAGAGDRKNGIKISPNCRYTFQS